jgi:hypothetical protein
MKRFLFQAGVLTALLCSCTPESIPTQLPPQPNEVASPTESPIATEIPLPGSPLEWLVNSPFQPMPEATAELILTDLPEGFVAGEPDYMGAPLPSGLEVKAAEVIYQWSTGDQMENQDSVAARVFSYESVEARTEHLEGSFAEGYVLEYQTVADQRLAHFYNDDLDHQMWISGPFLIVITSDPSIPEIGPRVDEFVTLYLELYPPN